MCENLRGVSHVMLRSAATKHLGDVYAPPPQFLRFAQNDILTHALTQEYQTTPPLLPGLFDT